MGQEEPRHALDNPESEAQDAGGKGPRRARPSQRAQAVRCEIERRLEEARLAARKDRPPMGLAGRAADWASRAADAARAWVGGARSERQPRRSSSGRVVRIARLPTRIYADGPAERSVAAEGLFGLARLTIHEAELTGLAAAGAEPSSPDLPDLASTSQPAKPSPAASPSGGSVKDMRRSKYYAVVSVGQQTFASKRVKRAPAPAATPAQAPASSASPASSAAKRFVWNESTDVVLQKAGASIAQVAIYRSGRVDGALGDTLQCWCQLDLASYFEGQQVQPPPEPAPAAEAGQAAGAGQAAAEGHAGHATGAAELASAAAAVAAHPPAHTAALADHPAPPPAVLRTSAPSTLSLVSLGGESSAGDLGTEGSEHDGSAGGGAGAAAPAEAAEGSSAGAEASAEAAGGGEQHAATEPGETPGGSRPSRAGSCDGEVLHAAWLPLVDPGDASVVCGRVRVTVRAASPAGLEQQLWRRLLGLADLNGDGTLCADEFEGLLEAMGSDLRPEEVAALFAQADRNGDGRVDAAELAGVLTACHAEGELHRLMRRCPVDGAELTPGDDVANIMYVTLALDEGTGESLRGGYTTPQQVSRSWLLSISEWATQPLAGAPSALWRGNKYKAGGLRKGAAAAHILVMDRKTKRVVEEAVPTTITLALRALYQSAAGRFLLREGGGLKKLKSMTEKYGAFADSPESAADIPKFLATFKGEVDLQEALLPDVSAYKCFNEFFYRKLKPGARPIAARGDPSVIVSAADCRLMTYSTVGDATRCWVKGKRFSLAGMLGSAEAAAGFEGGSMAIFRLAPQDYHRFHFPVGGRVDSIADIPGELLTVNPIAVNSPYADVFTRNKRSVLLLSSPDYGRVAYVAVGATIVGSILWTVQPGQEVAKGDEAGYFAFGGSTIVVLFQTGAACWDEDLAQNSLQSLETRVRMGERLGVRGTPAGEAAPQADGLQPAPQADRQQPASRADAQQPAGSGGGGCGAGAALASA